MHDKNNIGNVKFIDRIIIKTFRQNIRQNRIVDSGYKNYKKKSQLHDIWKRYKKNKLALIGLIIIIILILMALFAPLIVDYDKEVIGQDYTIRLLGPSIEHPFGTDAFGRDILFRILYGARLSLFIGITVITSSMLVGLIIGTVAGYYGGHIDNIIMRIIDIFMAIPPLLLAIVVVAVLGPNLINLIIAMGVAYVPFFSRVARAPVLQIREKEYIEAAKSVGTSDYRIITRHIWPNMVAPIIVQFSLGVGDAIKTAAGLSFIGLGIQPPTPEWGTMLSQAKDFMRDYPYLIWFPGVFIIITVLSLNLVGDGLQDSVDPKLKD